MDLNYVPPTMVEPTNLPERVATILNGLRDLAARHAVRNWVLIPVTVLFSAYLGSVIRRFTALAARVAAGTMRLRPPRPKRPDIARDRGPPKPRLPSRVGWVIEWLGYHAMGRSSQLRHLFTDDPEMVALMAASPQGGRIFRPLCRMLRIEPGPDLPPSLFPPRREKASAQEAAAPVIATSARTRDPHPVPPHMGKGEEPALSPLWEGTGWGADPAESGDRDGVASPATLSKPA